MTSMFKWRHQYNIESDEYEGALAAIEPEGESLTIQGAPDADINVLMARMGVKDGSILPATLGVTDPRYYGDFTNEPDLRTALDIVRNAEEHFMALPATLRNKFDNDPWKLHRWVHVEANIDEAVKLGLLKQAAPKTEPKPNET